MSNQLVWDSVGRLNQVKDGADEGRTVGLVKTGDQHCDAHLNLVMTEDAAGLEPR